MYSRLLRVGIVNAPRFFQPKTLLRRCYCTNNKNGSQFLDISRFGPEKTRNFCIIAHIDHGKTTLSDRIMEATGAISSREDASDRALVLDKLQVEKERGITVKAQTCSMIYNFVDGENKEELLYNLIDTPVNSFY